MSITTFIYPPLAPTSDPTVGLIGDVAPSSAILTGAVDALGDLRPLQVSTNGLKVDVISSALAPDAATETTLQTLATEATVATLGTEATLSTLATEATVATLATETTLALLESTAATLATEATVATLATEATLSTLATEATVATLGTEATLATLATEATVATLATESTVATLATESTVSTLASQATAEEIANNTYNSYAVIAPTLDLNNSSTTPLLANATFTGLPIPIINAGTINVSVHTDVDSAVDGLKFQFSPDGVNWDHTHSFSVTGNIGTSYNQAAEMSVFRVVYVNGNSNQTHFRLTTLLKNQAVGPSKYSIGQSINDNILADVTKSVIWGKTTGGGGGYVAVKVNPSGALTADVTGTVAATQSGTWNINNISGTVSLPTGAATETTLAALNAKVTAVNTGAVTVSSSALPTGAATETTLAAMNAKMLTGAGTATGALRVALATDSAGLMRLQDAGSREITVKASSTPAATSDTSLVVALSPNSNTVKTGGLAKANAPVYNNYASTSVTTGAYVQIVASTTSATQMLSIFDSSGQAMILAVGTAGSEVDQVYIPPGGGDFSLNIPASSRVSLKALTADATSGYILVNFLGGN